MNPAPSIIIFTVLSGIGFGLIALLSLGFVPLPAALWAGLWACGLSCAGLISSTFHLGHPERSLRALTQWRSSWLSREGVLAIVALAGFALYMIIWWASSTRPLILGVLIALSAFFTIFATSMIYAQLKTVPRWNQIWTPCLFLFTGFGGAFCFLIFLERPFYTPPAVNIFTAEVFLIMGMLASLIWHYRAGRIHLESTPETATGLGRFGEVSLLEAPHTAPNYLMKEMIYEIGRRRAFILRLGGFLCGYIVPLGCFFLLEGQDFMMFLFLTILACLSHLLGTFALRWLFFAQARHVVALYYGKRA